MQAMIAPGSPFQLARRLEAFAKHGASLFNTVTKPHFDWRSEPRTPYNSAVRSHYLSELYKDVEAALPPIGKTKDDLKKKMVAILQQTRARGREGLEFNAANNASRSRMTQDTRTKKMNNVTKDRRNQRKRKVFIFA
jgi:hypothetical protein